MITLEQADAAADHYRAKDPGNVITALEVQRISALADMDRMRKEAQDRGDEDLPPAGSGNSDDHWGVRTADVILSIEEVLSKWPST